MTLKRQEGEQEWKELALGVARYFEIPIVTGDGSPGDLNKGNIWDGALHIDGLGASDILHEVAHWLCAPVSRRRLPGFGLGPDSWGGQSERSVTADEARVEEERASAIGILAERFFGLPWKRTFSDHAWDGDDSGKNRFATISRSKTAAKMLRACRAVRRGAQG